HKIGIFDARDLDKEITGGGDVREVFDLVAHGGVEWLWNKRSTFVVHDDVCPACLQSDLPALLETMRHSDERNQRGDTDGDSGKSECGAERPAQKAADNYGKEGHDPVEGIAAKDSSETMRPSIIRKILPARCAIVGS